MKIFAIRDNYDGKIIDIGYFFYYEKSGEYYIELNEGLDEWDCPFIIDHFVREGQLVMDQYYSRLFISQRIVPQDRQNLGQILKDNGLEEYDEARLFILADGRCAQDECYIVPIAYEKLPKQIRQRRNRITSVNFHSPCSYILTFADGRTGRVELPLLGREDGRISRLLAYKHLLKEAYVSPAGTELILSEQVRITYDRLYRAVTMADSEIFPHGDSLREFMIGNLATTQDAMDMLQCTRQNVNDLVKRGRLVPLDLNGKIQMFLKSDIQKLL